MNPNQAMTLGRPRWVVPLLAVIGAASTLAACAPAEAGDLDARFQQALANRTAVRLAIGAAGPIKMFLNPEDPMVTKRLVEERTWEPNETHWFLKRVKPGHVVVDVGANVGYYTLIAGKLVGETGRVYAFEPDPSAFAILERNVALNGLTNVVLEQKAASNEPGTLRLYLSEENKGDHRIFETEEARESIEIEAVALDDYFEGREPRIDFIKIDTQGAEAVIIDGLDRVIRANPAITLVVEFWPRALHEFGRESDALLEKFEGYGFHFFSLGVWGKPSPLRLVKPAELSQKLTIENDRFTNLLLTRQLPPGKPKTP